jgi:tetratricopeptide (TPR) repeat protein
LHAAECEALLAALAGGLDPVTQAHVVAASEGNPLFAVEMVALALEGGDVTASPTIAAILAARLDQLGDDERAVIERGAVEGKVFHSGAVRALTPDLSATSIDEQLSRLVRKDLVRPQAAADFAGEDAYRFRHLLVRDAAYDALPKRVRADLHEQFAVWLEQHAGGLIELDELVGWHLEQAVRYRRELGIDVEPGLAARAGERLLDAADGALARADSHAADKLLTRALDLLTADNPRRPEALVTLADIALRRGDLERGDRLITAAEAQAGGPTAATVATRLDWLISAEPDRAAQFVHERVEPLLEQLRGSDDHAGLASLHFAMFNVRWLAADAAGTLQQLRLAGEHAQRAGKLALLRQSQLVGSGPLMYGPATADEMRDAVASWEAAAAGPMVEAGLLMVRAQLALMAGDLAEVRAASGKAVDFLRDLGLDVLAATQTDLIAEAAIADGDVVEAVRVLRRADEGLAAVGERSFRSTIVASLARALYLAGDADEAERRAIEAVEISAPDDLVNFIITHAVRAQILADRGDLDAAEELGRSSLAYAERTDFPVQRAQARAGLAYALARAGRVDEARALLDEAVALCEAKGDRTHAGMMRTQVAAISSTT